MTVTVLVIYIDLLDLILAFDFVNKHKYNKILLIYLQIGKVHEDDPKKVCVIAFLC